MNVSANRAVHGSTGMWPTNDQLTKTYKAMCEQARQNGTAKQLNGPPVKNPNAYPSYNITPEGLQDMGMRAFVINGKLYERDSFMMPSPGGLGMSSSWFEIGPAPMFAQF